LPHKPEKQFEIYEKNISAYNINSSDCPVSRMFRGRPQHGNTRNRFNRIEIKKSPLFIERDNQGILEITLIVSETEKPPGLKTIELFIQKNSHPEIISSITADYIVKDGEDYIQRKLWDFGQNRNLVKISGNRLLEPGEHTFHININVPRRCCPRKKHFDRKSKVEFRWTAKTG
jgi:hypothetical protein